MMYYSTDGSAIFTLPDIDVLASLSQLMESPQTFIHKYLSNPIINGVL